MEDLRIPKDVVTNISEYPHSANRILSRVIREGLWRQKDDEGGYLVSADDRIKEPQKLERIVREEWAKRQIDYDANLPSLPEPEVLQDKTQKLLARGINGLLDAGIVTPEIVELASRWTRPEDIQIADPTEGVAGRNVTTFDIDDTIFPEGEKRPTILIGANGIGNRINFYQDIAKKAGVSLSSEVLFNSALQSLVVHEWSHSIQKAMEILYYQGVIKDEAYNDEEDGWTALWTRHRIIWHQAKDVCAPAIDAASPRIEAEIDGERFASGFTVFTTKEALVEDGVQPDDAQRFVDVMVRAQNEDLAGFRRIRAAAGFSDDELANLSSDINEVMRKATGKSAVKNLWSALGYDAPYSAEELKTMLEGTMQVVKSPTERRRVLEAQKAA